MEKLLISACLTGVNCKYSGGNNKLDDGLLEKLKGEYILVPVCPEADGGLTTPRDPSERVGELVLSCFGQNVTEEFVRGAHMTLERAVSEGCTKALMKELSPSCGSGRIYDGTFSGTVVDGYGVTAELLEKNQIKVYGESEADKLLR